MKECKENDKLNIVMLGQKMVPSRAGGVELVLTTMCPIMVEKGIDVTCINRKGTPADDVFSDGYTVDTYKGVKLKSAATIKAKGLAAMSSSFFASIKAAFGKYDIVHYHAEGPAAMIWIPKLFKKKCVVTVHGLDWQRAKWQKGFGHKYIKFGERMLVRYADEIIVLSENVKNYFKCEYDRDTVFIPNGVSAPVVRHPDRITDEFGLKGQDYYLSLCRLTEEKGIHYLIEAYNRMNTDRKLVIAGGSSDTDDYVNRLKLMAAGNSNIIFTGFVSGNLLDELYSNAYAYILPSDIEGMPLSLLEAMSYGNAVIVSDIRENADVIDNMGITFKKGSADDLAEKMTYLDENPELSNKLRSSSAKYILDKYNWDNVADRTIELYRKIEESQ
ncbi:MAG: glycosyltransferase family 4 protein [Lachnospiraceae bacterium]|nr:glycosyltransferase family 4 protein [Lachnospiraceae bacterium]